ncbi:hypothetical protein [Yoonia sediminilitoris]|uniref:Uncharacterized protein n=1 Tax=Yoonia sediminilitoris TaxID=1286148 RepID=A0A2T6KMD9_9RHOB|nr:hypothetical protein [Yoonia sediminilitoris]PUB17388.1 hypothetical protein C8N45_102400 [Yoonia sediminilitoris]RCW97683.1 hypothetical protein DFP92_102400 [Yoonia sediminilitoris]
MKSDPAPELPFGTLRTLGIAAAQKLSGNIWTDYNLHDPGVTLLEQTAFALTEIAYQSDHNVRDLLTRQAQETDYGQLALFAPAEVLTSLPVTLRDIAGILSDITGVERVFTRNGPALGLVSLLIVPAELTTSDAERNTLVEQVRATFDKHRLLCSDVHAVEIATPQPVQLRGTLQIDPLGDPDAIAAEVIFRTKHVLRGIKPSHLNQLQGATRNDAFRDPSALLPALLPEASGAKQLDVILTAIKSIPFVQEVTHFDVISEATGLSIKESGSELAPNAYFETGRPTEKMLGNLFLRRDNAAIALNIHAINDELVRWEAAEIAAKGNRKDANDWDVLTQGQHRNIGMDGVDAMLPAIYRPAPHANNAAAKARTQASNQLSAYRRLTNAHLRGLIAPIAGLSDRFCISQTIDDTDPAQVRERVAVLDYLIALQGEAMPKIDPVTLHTYRGLSQQERWKVSWRADYLANLAAYNSLKGSADPVHGFVGRVTHLADLQQPGQSLIDASLVKLIRQPQPALRASPDAQAAPPEAPFDVFVNRRDDVAPLDQEGLARYCPWLLDGQTTPDLFRLSAQQTSYKIFEIDDKRLELRFDPGAGYAHHICDTGTDRNALEERGNQIRLTFQMLNQQAEEIWLIEDIRLRQDAVDFSPATAYALLPNWTLRTQDPAFQQFISNLVRELAPAHVHVRLSWLSPWKMELVKTRHARWKKQPDKANTRKLRATLRRLGDCP